MILEPLKIKSLPLFTHLFPRSDGTGCHDLSVTYLSYSPLSRSSKGTLVLLHFLPQVGVICIYEVIDIFPGNIDCSLCFIQPRFPMKYFPYKLNKQGDNIQT